MKQSAIDEANEQYDKLELVLKGREIPSWNKVLEAHSGDVEKAREVYHADPVKQELWDAGIHVMGDYVETFKNSRQEFVATAARNIAMPYAVLLNGQRYEKGQMGWFGMSSGDKNQDQWNLEVNKMIESLSDDTLLTIVDCHI